MFRVKSSLRRLPSGGPSPAVAEARNPSPRKGRKLAKEKSLRSFISILTQIPPTEGQADPTFAGGVLHPLPPFHPSNPPHSHIDTHTHSLAKLLSLSFFTIHTSARSGSERRRRRRHRRGRRMVASAAAAAALLCALEQDEGSETSTLRPPTD